MRSLAAPKRMVATVDGGRTRRRVTPRAGAPVVEFWRDPSLPMIEGRRTSLSRTCYRDHTHPTLSIGIIDEGRCLARLGRMRRTLAAGEIIVIAPEQVHACNPSKEYPWAYRMFYIDAAWARKVTGLPSSGRLFPQGFISDPKARAVFSTIESVFSDTRPAIVRQRVLARCLKKLLGILAVRPSQTQVHADAKAFFSAKAFLDKNILHPVSLSRLSQEARIGPYRLIRIFKRETGLTPHAYQIDQRINHSRDLLKQGFPLADVAYATGFSDQSHFQRAFKSRVAATPATFRQ